MSGESPIEPHPTAILWNLLGKAISIAMLPWMIWVSVTIVEMQRDIAVMTAQTVTLPAEVRALRERLIRLESRVEIQPQ